MDPAEGDRRDAGLLAQVAAGDREGALMALYRRHGGAVLRLGVRELGDRGQAEDLVQETFVRVWRSAERFDPELSTARGWILMIARRVAIDQRRRAAVRPVGTELDAAPELAAPDEDVLERLARSEAVDAALAGLEAPHREVLELSFRSDLANAEIAERLGVPIGTVRSRTFYALRAMRGVLEGSLRA